MPDDLATAGVLTLFAGAFGAIPVVFLVSWLWRRATGAANGSGAGLAAGIGAWSIAMAVATWGMLGWVAEMRRGVEAQGRLVGFVKETAVVREPGSRLPASSGGRKVALVSPRVEFTTPDGRTHVVHGLGGSLSQLAPGDAVTVRYDPAHPADAVVADFQNELGAPGLFVALTVVGLMSSVWFALTAVAELRAERAAAAGAVRAGRARGRGGPAGAAPDSGRGRRGAAGAPASGAVAPAAASTAPASRFAAWRDRGGHRWGATAWRAGIGALVAGFAAPFVLAILDVELVFAFAISLGCVAVSLAGFAAAAALRRGATGVGLMLYGRSIGIVGFALFALWLGGLSIGR